MPLEIPFKGHGLLLGAEGYCNLDPPGAVLGRVRHLTGMVCLEAQLKIYCTASSPVVALHLDGAGIGSGMGKEGGHWGPPLQVSASRCMVMVTQRFDLSGQIVRRAPPWLPQIIWLASMRAMRESPSSHHPGALSKTGPTLWYVAEFDGQGVALFSLSAAARQWTARYAWMGWDSHHQYDRLKLVTNFSRFLILPQALVPHLASRVLASCQKMNIPDPPGEPKFSHVDVGKDNRHHQQA